MVEFLVGLALGFFWRDIWRLWPPGQRSTMTRLDILKRLTRR